MQNIKTHILFICDKCGRMKIVAKADHDLPTAIFCEITCEKCATGDFDTTFYYDTKGYMNERDGIFDSSCCLYCHKFYYHYASTSHPHTRNKFCCDKCESDYRNTENGR